MVHKKRSENDLKENHLTMAAWELHANEFKWRVKTQRVTPTHNLHCVPCTLCILKIITSTVGWD